MRNILAGHLSGSEEAQKPLYIGSRRTVYDLGIWSLYRFGDLPLILKVNNGGQCCINGAQAGGLAAVVAELSAFAVYLQAVKSGFSIDIVGQEDVCRNVVDENASSLADFISLTDPKWSGTWVAPRRTECLPQFHLVVNLDNAFYGLLTVGDTTCNKSLEQAWYLGEGNDGSTIVENRIVDLQPAESLLTRLIEGGLETKVSGDKIRLSNLGEILVRKRYQLKV